MNIIMKLYDYAGVLAMGDYWDTMIWTACQPDQLASLYIMLENASGIKQVRN